MAENLGVSERPLIALVDDEKDITQILAEDLSADYDAVQFNNPKQFLAAMKNHEIKPAVLVIDLKMPGMTGLEVLRELTEHGFSIPTIMFSGFLDKEDAITAVELGVLHIIEKPIDLGVVHEVVSESLIDWELMRIRHQIREQFKQIKEIYSSVRLAVAEHVPEDVVEKIFVTPQGESQMGVDDLLGSLEEKLDFLLREENLLANMKQMQHRRAIEKLAKRAS